MSTTVLLNPTEAAFDPKAFAENRNKAEQALKSGKEAPKVEAPAAETPKIDERTPEQRKSDSARSARRAATQAAYYKGMYEATVAAQKTGEAPKVEAKVEDPEPQRKDFATDAEHNRALGKWDARQETKKALSEVEKKGEEKQSLEAFRTELQEIDAKTVEDIKTFSDWDAVAKAAADDKNAPKFDPSKNELLTVLIARSPVKAAVLYHYAKPENYKAFEDMIELSKSPDRQIAAFHRLEGKLETLYSNPKAAQAGTSGSPEVKDRTHLAEAVRPGETAGNATVPKPKPSSAVSAPGGSPVPDAPKPGSQQWMDERNRRFKAR